MVVVIGDVSGVVAGHEARGVAECVPDRGPTTILVPGTFNLIRGGRRAEDEPRGEHQATVPVVGVARTHGACIQSICAHSERLTCPLVAATACRPATLADHLRGEVELTVACPFDRSTVKTALSPSGVVI